MSRRGSSRSIRSSDSKGISQKKPNDQLTYFEAQHVEIYEGMLPRPEMLEEYKKVIPNLPDKMVEWTDIEINQRKKIADTMLLHSLWTKIFYNIVALVAVLSVLATGVWFMIKGHPNQGATIITATVVSLAAKFVFQYRRSENSDE